ncbi:MAG: pyocin knob domain-containing protein [Lachnospiraceae bacterium]|nr:pyocin knob domain-containing protein [Lachnospiraceae bacterium]
MKTANYIGAISPSGKGYKYPLSTETLDFIQEQIHLLESLAGIGGKSYILRLPTDDVPGVAAVYHKEGNRQEDPLSGETELLYIAQTPKYSSAMRWLNVTTKIEKITADGVDYEEARKIRTAEFARTAGSESYELAKMSNFAALTGQFPTNAALAARLDNVRSTVLNDLKDIMAEKLTANTQRGLTPAQIDKQRTPVLWSCVDSVALFGMSSYTLIVTAQGNMVRQELIQGDDQHYVRTFSGGKWGAWVQQLETAMHLDVKIVGSTVWLRHGALPSDCDIVLLRKKKRGGKRATGGPNSYAKNRGKVKKRQAKRQYVHFKGIKLTKGEPGKWYVPKCTAVADRAKDGNLIGKELPSLCASLFYVGADGMCRVQGVRKKLILKSTTNKKGTAHRAFAPIGVQIARLKATGGKDSGGEIVRMKYRISQTGTRDPRTKQLKYTWSRTFSQD